MHRTHTHPEIYNPDVPHQVKCDIIRQLCKAVADYRKITPDMLRADIIDKLHVDFENLEHNPVGMLLLYEYLYSQRPAACMGNAANALH